MLVLGSRPAPVDQAQQGHKIATRAVAGDLFGLEMSKLNAALLIRVKPRAGGCSTLSL